MPLTDEQMKKMTKAQLIEHARDVEARWFATDSDTPVYDSIAHLDPRKDDDGDE